MTNWRNRISKGFHESLSLNSLLKVLVILAILYLLGATSPMWRGLLNVIGTILTPFLTGFVIAYILRPLIMQGEKRKISRKLIVPVVYLVLVLLLAWLAFTLVPTLADKLTSFVNSCLNAVNWLMNQYNNIASDSEGFELVSALVNALKDFLASTQQWLPSITTMLPSFFNNFLSFATTALFSVIISIYISFDYEKLTQGFDALASRLKPNLPKYFHAIDEEVGDYIHSLIILMFIRFFEYGILYFAIGHKDWLMMAFLTSVGEVIPYFGGTVANVIGLLTAVTLPFGNFMVLLVGILILSNVDAYVISPMVHSRNSHIKPLWTLFSVFAAGCLFGGIGIMIAVPLYLSIRAILHLVEEERNQTAKTEESSQAQ